MVHTLLPRERRLNDAAEGFGMCSGINNIPVENAFGSIGRTIGQTSFNEIPIVERRGNRVVLFPLLCGIFNQPKFLPLRYLQGLQIELEIVNNGTDVILTNRSDIAPADVGRHYFGNIPSTTWFIDQAVVKCDVITLDSQLDNEYTDHLMQGKSFPINFCSFVHPVQPIGLNDRTFISPSNIFTRMKC